MPRIPIEQLQTRLAWTDLDADHLGRLIALARAEDLSGAGLVRTPAHPGDATTALLPEGATGAARLAARTALVPCGLSLVDLVLQAYGGNCRFEAATADGDPVGAGAVLGRVEGPAKTLLQAERVLLNFLQHLSGIASGTRRHVEALGGGRTVLLDTRKTTPGYRALEKYAFACGGGCNHRLGLFDRVMLKDNHLAATGAHGGAELREAVRRARQTCPDLPVEVEVDRLEQIPPVLEAGADIILLDNFTNARLADAVGLVGGRAYTEASGGITLARLPELADLGLDFVSTGAPVHQSTWMDIGLDWEDV